jgi:hypothetical protein
VLVAGYTIFGSTEPVKAISALKNL